MFQSLLQVFTYAFCIPFHPSVSLAFYVCVSSALLSFKCWSATHSFSLVSYIYLLYLSSISLSPSPSLSLSLYLSLSPSPSLFLFLFTDFLSLLPPTVIPLLLSFSTHLSLWSPCVSRTRCRCHGNRTRGCLGNRLWDGKGFSGQMT